MTDKNPVDIHKYTEEETKGMQGAEPLVFNMLIPYERSPSPLSKVDGSR